MSEAEDDTTGMLVVEVRWDEVSEEVADSKEGVGGTLMAETTVGM